MMKSATREAKNKIYRSKLRNKLIKVHCCNCHAVCHYITSHVCRKKQKEQKKRDEEDIYEAKYLCARSRLKLSLLVTPLRNPGFTPSSSR